MTYRILLVDDLPLDKFLTKVAVEEARCNLEVVTAHDGLEAINKISEHYFDLVLLDLKMPGMDGYEFLEFLHQGRHPVGPVFVLSASDDELERKRALSRGAVDYIKKSLDFDEYKQQLADALVRFGF